MVKYVGIPKRFVVGEVVREDLPGECAEGVLVTLEGDGLKRETRSDIFGDFDFDGLEKNSTFKLRSSSGLCAQGRRGRHAARRRPGRGRPRAPG